jgi:hypothetical protein
MLTCPSSPHSPRFSVQLIKICVPRVRVQSNTNTLPPATNRGILLLLLVFLALEIGRNSKAINPLNTVNSVIFLFLLHFLGFRGGGLLATLFRTLGAAQMLLIAAQGSSNRSCMTSCMIRPWGWRRSDRYARSADADVGCVVVGG